LSSNQLSFYPPVILSITALTLSCLEALTDSGLLFTRYSGCLLSLLVIVRARESESPSPLLAIVVIEHSPARLLYSLQWLSILQSELKTTLFGYPEDKITRYSGCQVVLWLIRSVNDQIMIT